MVADFFGQLYPPPLSVPCSQEHISATVSNKPLFARPSPAALPHDSEAGCSNLAGTGQSDGDYKDATISRWAEDTAAVIDWLSKEQGQDQVRSSLELKDHSRVVVLGSGGAPVNFEAGVQSVRLCLTRLAPPSSS